MTFDLRAGGGLAAETQEVKIHPRSDNDEVGTPTRAETSAVPALIAVLVPTEEDWVPTGRKLWTMDIPLVEIRSWKINDLICSRRDQQSRKQRIYGRLWTNA